MTNANEDEITVRLRKLISCLQMQSPCMGSAKEMEDEANEIIDRLTARLREAEARNAWISTKDRLPEKPGKASYEYVECLIYYRGEILCRPWNCEHLVWDDEAHDDFFCKPTDPTHWMPLPEPPTKEQP